MKTKIEAHSECNAIARQNGAKEWWNGDIESQVAQCWRDRIFNLANARSDEDLAEMIEDANLYAGKPGMTASEAIKHVIF